MTGFWQRLKQRKLVQWAIAYVAFAFSLIQVLDVVADSYTWPRFAMHLVFGVLILGFAVVLLLAWYHGERGAQHASGAELLLIALALAIGGGLLWHFGHAPATIGTTQMATRTHGAPAASAAAVGTTARTSAAVPISGASVPTRAAPHVAARPIPAKSIAVLPFLNESGSKDQQYFSDGLSEDLITALSQFAGLKVISRDSSFRFRHSKDSTAEIGAKLGVAHLLDGSVQRAGNEVRISATLVNAADGRTLWSHHYDRPYKDLFALQDDITRAVAKALKAKLMTTPGAVVQSDRPPSGGLAAYNAFLQGKFHEQRFTEAEQRKAIHFYQQAARLDPRYALAYAQIGYEWANIAGNFLQTPDQYHAAYAKARAAIATALKLEPNLAAAHYAKAFVLTVADLDYTAADAAYHRAAQLAPDNAKFEAAFGYSRAVLGHSRQAVTMVRQALVRDPLCQACYSSLALILPGLGDLNAALHASRKAVELNPTSYFALMQLVYNEVLRGDAKSALQEAEQTPPGSWRDISMALALQIGDDRAAANAALQHVIATQAGNAAYQIAEIYALRRNPDNMFTWLERARHNHDPGITQLLTDPPILRYRDDPRFAAFCKQVGLPTTTDAVALK